MKCKGHFDEPHTNPNTGQAYWIARPCEAEAITGKHFCIWHDKPDYLPPENIEHLLNQKENKG